MSGRTVAVAAIGLWLITAVIAGFFFVKGQTRMAADDRLAVVLAPAERDFVLAEMRMLLEGVQGITGGVARNDMQQVASAARRIGMASAADVNPGLMLKLPLAFKQQGMALHGQFDRLAERAENGATSVEILELLSQQLSSCVACHGTFRLDVAAEAGR